MNNFKDIVELENFYTDKTEYLNRQAKVLNDLGELEMHYCLAQLEIASLKRRLSEEGK